MGKYKNAPLVSSLLKLESQMPQVEIAQSYSPRCAEQGLVEAAQAILFRFQTFFD